MPNKDPRHRFFKKAVSDNAIRVAKVPFREQPPTEPIPRKYLSEVRRRRLEFLRNKENAKAKRSRLCHILIQKLRNKYGASSLKVINSTVDKFLEGREDVSAEDLAVLESKVKEAIRLKRAEITAAKAAATEGHLQGSASATDRMSGGPASDEVKPGQEWNEINKYDNMIAEEKERQKTERLLKNRSQFRAALDKQLKYARELEEKQKVEDRVYAAFVQDDVKKFTEEELVRKAAIKKKQNDERLKIEQQLKLQATLRAQQEHANRSLDQKILNSARADVVKEEEKVQALREKERQRVQRIIQENKENDALKAEARQRQFVDDQRIMKQYEEKLIKEQEDRDNAFKKRLEKLREAEKKFEASDAGTAAQERKQREEDLAIIERKRREYQSLLSASK